MPVQAPLLTVRAVRAVPVKVPMTYTLGTSAAIVREAPLLLVSLETEEGVTGHAGNSVTRRQPLQPLHICWKTR